MHVISRAVKVHAECKPVTPLTSASSTITRTNYPSAKEKGRRGKIWRRVKERSWPVCCLLFIWTPQSFKDRQNTGYIRETTKFTTPLVHLFDLLLFFLSFQMSYASVNSIAPNCLARASFQNDSLYINSSHEVLKKKKHEVLASCVSS